MFQIFLVNSSLKSCWTVAAFQLIKVQPTWIFRIGNIVIIDFFKISYKNMRGVTFAVLLTISITCFFFVIAECVPRVFHIPVLLYDVEIIASFEVVSFNWVTNGNSFFLIYLMRAEVKLTFILVSLELINHPQKEMRDKIINPDLTRAI